MRDKLADGGLDTAVMALRQTDYYPQKRIPSASNCFREADLNEAAVRRTRSRVAERADVALI
jgi:hypothetical protein